MSWESWFLSVYEHVAASAATSDFKPPFLSFARSVRPSGASVVASAIEDDLSSYATSDAREAMTSQSDALTDGESSISTESSAISSVSQRIGTPSAHSFGPPPAQRMGTPSAHSFGPPTAQR